MFLSFVMLSVQIFDAALRLLVLLRLVLISHEIYHTCYLVICYSQFI